MVEVDDEIVIALPLEDDDPAGAFDTSWLDRTASVAWHCFDGTISIDGLVGELDGVFVGGREEIREDLIELARTFGRSGLLHGVRPDPRPERPEPMQPSEVPVGTPVDFEELTHLSGPTVDPEASERRLLIKWSPGCAYCRQITTDLAELVPELHRHLRAHRAGRRRAAPRTTWRCWTRQASPTWLSSRAACRSSTVWARRRPSSWTRTGGPPRHWPWARPTCCSWPGARAGASTTADGQRSSQRELRQAMGIPQRQTSRSVIAMGTGDVATILRSSALEVWESMGQRWTSPATLAEVIAERHLVSADEVAGDLEPFIDQLLAEGLLESRPVGAVAERRATDH